MGVFAIFAELFACIFAIIIQPFVGMLSIIIQLLATMFEGMYWSTEGARRANGLRRVLYAISGLCAIYMAVGLFLPIFTDFNSIISSLLFSWKVMLAVFIFWIMNSIILVAMSFAAAAKLKSGKDGEVEYVETASSIKMIGVKFCSYVLVFGLISIASAQYERKTTKDKLCDAVAERISKDWKERGDKLKALSEQLLKKDISGLNPCKPKRHADRF